MATAHKAVTTRGGSGKVVKRTLPPWVYPSELPGDTGDSPGTIAQMTLPATNGRIPVVYGRQRLGGDIFALVQDSVTRRLVAGIGLCEGEIQQVESFTMDDGTDPSYFGSYTSYTGTLTQSADTVLTTALLSTVGKLEKYPGLAYLVFEYLTTAPEIRWPRPIVKGRKIYDPRENRLTNSETFSSPTWTCSGTFPTHASGIADRPGYTNASRWTFGGSGPYTMSRQTSGLGLGTGDAVTVTLEMRCAAGATVTLTAAKSVGGASASTSCTVTSTWKQFEVTLAAGSGTGEGKIQVSAIPSSTVLEVAFASVQKTSENYGYVKTTASAVTAQTAYSANPALEMLDLKSNQDFGQGVPTASIDLASVGRAAAYCDEVVDHGEKRWECHITIREPAAAEEWFKTIGIHFGGFWRFKSGKWNLYYGHPDPVVAMSITTSHIVGSPKCRRGTTAGLLDAPNRVTTRWIDAAGGTWDEIPVYAQTSDVETAGTEVREFSPQTPGYQLKTQAERCANRLLNRVLADLMCSVDITLDGAALAPGDRVQVTDASVGLSAQDFLVVNMRRNDDAGTITLELEEYDEAIWTGTAGATDTAPTVTPPSPWATPPNVTGTSANSESSVVIASSTEYKVQDIWMIPYSLPTYPFGLQLRVRAASGAGSSSYTWSTAAMANSEQIIPLHGNRLPSSSTVFRLAFPGVVTGYTDTVYNDLGQMTNSSTVVNEAIIIIRLESITGVLSSGVTITQSSAVASSSASPNSAVQLQPSTPGTAQSGNANLSGKVKAGQLEADPQDAGTVPLEVDNVASPTVALATFRLNNVEQSKIDKKGSLQTLESSRIAPWVETMVVATATTINSTTAADLNGLTVTFTPPSDCRAMIVAVLDAKMTTTGSGFLGELVVNGTPDTNQIIFNPQTNNERVPITGVWTVALTGGTSYTIKMQGKLNGGAGVFSIAAGSRFSFVAVGKF